MQSRSAALVLSILVVLALLLAIFPRVVPPIPLMQHVAGVGAILLGLGLVISALLVGERS